MRSASILAFAFATALSAAAVGQTWSNDGNGYSPPAPFGESVAADFAAAPDPLQPAPQPQIRIDAVSAEFDPAPPPTVAEWLRRDAGPLTWDIQAGTVVFWRDNQASNGDLLHPDWLEFPGFVGPKLTLGVSGSGGHGVEASWFWFGAEAEGWFHHWDGFFITEYYSSLSSGEVNYVYSREGLSLLAGVRLMRWSEHYEDFATRSGRVLQMHTDNDLIGGQLGLRWRRDRRILFWEATGKVGVFGNSANQSQILYHNIYSSPSWSSAWPRGYDSDAAVMLDLNLTVGVHLSRVWSLRYGYNLLWLDQIALAPDQYRWNNSGQIQTDGSVLLNGIEAMLEARW